MSEGGFLFTRPRPEYVLDGEGLVGDESGDRKVRAGDVVNLFLSGYLMLLEVARADRAFRPQG
jgi:hypothetical protein